MGDSTARGLRSTTAILALVAFTTILGGCGIFGKGDADKTANWSAQRLYQEAEDELTAGSYANAIKYFQMLQTRFPFGRYAQQALLETAYAQYKDSEKELALSAADRFIKQYPNSPNVDYVYYLKGLINFNDNLGFLSAITAQDLTERDPKALRDSFDAFRDLVVRFPESKYTPDAIVRLKYLVNAMAAHEVHVARYYLRRGAYVAAANRAQIVVQQYQQAPAVHDALEIMAAAYDGLKMPVLRDDTQRVLAANFPAGSEVVKDKKPWWQFW